MIEADRWMREGIEQINTGRSRFAQVKQCAMNSGIAFMKAREAVKTGNFNEFMQTYENEIARSTVYRNIEFVENCLASAAAEKPEIKDDPRRLFEHACKMVLQSPKHFVALMRQLGEMRRFGEYDAVKYARRRLMGQQQLELDFVKVFGWVDSLTHIDQALLEIPEGKTESEALGELETGLVTALEKVRARRGTVDVEEIKNDQG